MNPALYWFLVVVAVIAGLYVIRWLGVMLMLGLAAIMLAIGSRVSRRRR